MAGDGMDRLWAPWRMAYIRSAAKPEHGAAAAPRTRAGGARGGRAATKPGPKVRGAGRRKPADPGCLFCRVRASHDDRADLVLARRSHAFLLLNRFPYNPAHLMVAVHRHVASFAELGPEERQDLLDLTALAERALAAEYRPDGVNYGANVGTVAGAGFPGHLHLHLVPRWNGDTNFMPIVGGTKVIPESLGRTWTRLRGACVASARAAARPASRGARSGRR